MKYITPLVFTILFVLASCKSTPIVAKDPLVIKPGTSSTHLSSVTDNINDSTGDIKESAIDIIEEAANAKQSIDTVYDESTNRKPLDAALDSISEIDSKADLIVKEADYIGEEIEKMIILQDEVDRLEDKIVELNSVAEETKKKALERLYGYITIFWVIGFILIAAGAAIAFFANKTFGGTISLVGILMLGFAAASQYYMEQIALVGAILLIVSFVGGVAMIGWSIIKNNRKTDAMKEIIEMIEILKETMTDDEKERIFGEKGLASRVQSSLTKEIINQIRDKNGFLKLKQIREEATQTKPTNL